VESISGRLLLLQDLPYVLEDIEPLNTFKGIDGTSFKIKLSRRVFGHGDIITYDKYNGVGNVHYR
jgi:hypothetical protein